MTLYNNKKFITLKKWLPDFVERDILDIPVIEATEIDISEINNSVWMMGYQNISPRDKLISHKILHGFKFDDFLHRFINEPYRLLAKAARAYAVCPPDISFDPNGDFHEMYDAIYLSRWVGCFLQIHGAHVIPTVGWSVPKYYDICFSGLRDGGVFIMSTLGTHNDYSKQYLLEGYLEMRRRFPNTKIICIGDKFDEMDSDVCYVKYEESFGNWNLSNKGTQLKMFNWNLSVAKGV